MCVRVCACVCARVHVCLCVPAEALAVGCREEAFGRVAALWFRLRLPFPCFPNWGSGWAAGKEPGSELTGEVLISVSPRSLPWLPPTSSPAGHRPRNAPDASGLASGVSGAPSARRAGPSQHKVPLATEGPAAPSDQDRDQGAAPVACRVLMGGDGLPR